MLILVFENGNVWPEQAWTFWEAEVPYPKNHPAGTPVMLMCKATDIGYNSQPENAESIWNIRGLNNNSWHRISVDVATDDDDDDDVDEE
jgi:sulfite oxidase